MSEQAIPEGYKPYRTDGTYTDNIAPLYLKMVDGKPFLGMRVEKHHCNFNGTAHGGCLMTLMDVALAGAVCNALGQYTSTPTINISFDFMAAARLGDWIYTEILSVDLTRTMGFVNAMIQGPGGHVARVSGSFKLPSENNRFPGMPAEEYHQWRTGNES